MSEQSHHARRDVPQPPADDCESEAEAVMARESPEGRGPHVEARKKSMIPFIVVLVVFAGAVTAAFVLLPPGMAALATAGVVLLYVICGAPAWGSAVLRRKEEKEAERRVEKAHG